MHWLEFLHSIKRDSSLTYYQSMVPDSTVWSGHNPFKAMLNAYLKQDEKNKTFYSPSGGKYFISDDYFLYYPVVGITYFQATNFCHWRSEAIRKKADNYNKTFQVTFRLPTEEEWIYAASAGLDTGIYSFGYKKYTVKPSLIPNPNFYWKLIKDTTQISHHLFNQVFLKYLKYGDEPFFNCTKNFLKFFNYGMLQPESVYDLSNRPPRTNKHLSLINENKVDRTAMQYSKARANEYGISNMIGNAAEMTLTEGIAKGGSWAHSLDNCKVSTRYYYYTATNWLGFRCVAEITIR